MNCDGSMILDPRVIDDVSIVLGGSAEAFWDDANRRLASHLFPMNSRGEKIDDTLLVNRLKTAGDYDAIGGAAYLSKVATSVPNAAHAVYYARILREKFALRQTLETLLLGVQQCLDELPSADVIAAVE